ncbi:succinylglutamate desuccinylase/aspartoacylase family protein [Rhodoferax aquaticus]|uniref:Succinylglutamate desuccinylase/aspartoacylase family protein n=1 Tax=Rhodoferax aquaticus TaxID=2527691 RepID=A0A515EPB5_9BURK|nr:succinylglutamate desuccinylase/aspartoacylase family protein [Rhodoferax aquaticus]QDL54508.1 succinylglutamate desuccinylase/aspartoacylase family protein [Rhodoferax aquaticus]
MQRVDHPLLSQSLGSQKTLTSFHYGNAGEGKKIYIQASLHAEELPGMLVAHKLRSLLEAEETAGRIQGEIVLVPVANPIGLSQRLDHKPMGRFELESSENFNRHYPDFAKAIAPQVKEALGNDPAHNVQVIRQAMAAYLHNWKPSTELQSLRHRLLNLAFDADQVLDLHCDCEGVMHFYTEESCWPTLEPLAYFLHSEAILLAKGSGGGPFDECLSGVWWQLSEQLKAQGCNSPIPQGCCTTTIELRGEADVGHAWAQADAAAILHYLQHMEVLASSTKPLVPPAKCKATPLAGSETLYAPAAGLVVFAAKPGQYLKVGDLLAEVIDPLTPTVHSVLAGVEGVLYAHIRERYVLAGGELAKIAGAIPFRTGELLGF